MEDRIRLPVHIHDLLYKRGKIIRQFKKAGKSFTDDDIAAALNISRKSLEALKKARPHFVQPRTFTMEGEELNTLQEIADRDKGVLERLEIKGMAALADKIIGEDLDVREGFILREAIGKPGHCSPSNNQDIGNKLGISREAVRISRNAARKKVVARMQEHGLEACEIG